MKTVAQITAVKLIMGGKKPVVVFELNTGQTLFRYPKQALIDLQNSTRALSIPQHAFDNGIQSANAIDRETFQVALGDCIGAVITADIISHKAGDTYVVEANHPSITDKSHPDYGTAKVGDQKIAEKDGNRIEGFISIPLTDAEKMRRDVSKNIATAMMQMYGFGNAPAPIAIQPTVVDAVLGNPADAFEDMPDVVVTDKTADVAGISGKK